MTCIDALKCHKDLVKTNTGLISVDHKQNDHTLYFAKDYTSDGSIIQ